MSHPNPHHDRENERVEDSKFAPKSKKYLMASKMSKFNKAAAAHKAGAPYKSFEEAVKSKTYKAMHKARKDLK